MASHDDVARGHAEMEASETNDSEGRPLLCVADCAAIQVASPQPFSAHAHNNKEGNSNLQPQGQYAGHHVHASDGNIEEHGFVAVVDKVRKFLMLRARIDV
ncbi:hypothetical protein CIT26_25995 [Mesorhizobium temperatum]|uniref:Uncharacterized protein n=1 Tax=Mesorhizobium temperatum TaxID=241416 RepID=A0A271LGY9_9HYPH|nr:hypothetical protein CIT26_25995 [Mesorhizobium temperatum]